MNTVLIAEDEKLLRAGLKTMVGRSGVPISEILEARDEAKALEILRSRRVDLLITDIRMPKMDGIELVSRLSELEHTPAVLVVNGYDDFSYAVEMMRNGVQDYLLKPVERERLYSAIRKTEEQYCSREAAKETREREHLDALRQFMLDPDAEGEAWRDRLGRYGGEFFRGSYVGFCSAKTEKQLPPNTLVLQAVGSVTFYAAAENSVGFLENTLTLPIGKSNAHVGLDRLHLCYREAYSAWQTSFFTESAYRFEEKEYAPLNVTAKQLVGLVGLSKWQDASKLLRGESARVFRGETEPRAFAELCRQFVEQLIATYPNLIGDDRELRRYGDIWDFGSVNRYFEAMDERMEDFCSGATAVFSNFENKQKIRRAVQYVQAHFREPLNMAEVSNRVSMDYSLFSTLFKQYTGVNFVNYLQNLRIDETKRLLETTDWHIYEIGRRAGFTDDKHFLKIFKSVVGFSPTEYRKSLLLTDRRGNEESDT
ncbi:MAG: response regulator [Bacteroides sp.]|nr:response regulator [Bacteroides sp.]